MGLLALRWGVLGMSVGGGTVPPRRGLTYQSQEVVGRMERVDATGVFLGCLGLAFVPSPPPGFPEKITEWADSSRP